MNIESMYSLHHPVRLYAGPDATKSLHDTLASLGCKNPFIIVSKSAVASGIGDMLAGSDSKQFSIDIDQGFHIATVDITTEVVPNLVDRYQKQHHDGLLALGGGAVIDLAKAVKLSILGTDATQESNEGFCLAIRGDDIPFIAVPTTIGSGSGASRTAYIYSPQLQRTLRFIQNALFPQAVFLDPRLLRAVSPTQTVFSVAAILGRALESIFSALSNNISEIYALRAIELLNIHAFRVVHTPHDLQSRLGIAMASHLVGIATSSSRESLAHATAIVLEQEADIPYGQGMMIMIPHALRFNLSSGESVLNRFAKIVGTSPNTEDCITWIQDFFTQLFAPLPNALPLRLYDIIDKQKKERLLHPEQLQLFAQQISDATDLLTSRVLPTEQDILKVLEAAYWGYPLAQTVESPIM